MPTPTFRPSAAQRENVEIMMLLGESEEAIAKVIGCSRPTLRKHFADELANGRARKRLEVGRAMLEAARQGNASAARRLLDVSADRGNAHGSKARPMGKKESLQWYADHPPPEWADLVS